MLTLFLLGSEPILDHINASFALILGLNDALLSCTDEVVVDKVGLVVEGNHTLPHARPDRNFVRTALHHCGDWDVARRVADLAS